MTDRPEWMRKGNEVVLFVRKARGDYNPRKATILSVAAKSFTVKHANQHLGEIRIRIDTLESKDQGSTWDRWYYAVTTVDSEKAAELFAVQRRERVEMNARNAARRWLDGAMSLEDLRKALDVLAAAQADQN